MADLTKAELRNRVLQHIGVLAAGQSASGEDANMVDESIDAAHERLRKMGLVPFATSAIPPWAQAPLRDYVAGDVAATFGMREPSWKEGQMMAERDLARQVAGFRHDLRTTAEYF